MRLVVPVTGLLRPFLDCVAETCSHPQGSSLLPWPLLQHALKSQSFFNSPSQIPAPSTYPNGLWFQGTSVAPEPKLVLRIAPVMGKGSSHVKCDSQWQACLTPQGGQRRPSPCCPAVSHIRNPVASLGNYAAPVELRATTTEGSLLGGGLPRQGRTERRTHTHRPSSHPAPNS